MRGTKPRWRIKHCRIIEGQHRDAEPLYKRVLALDPHHADALHLYGCLSDEQNRCAAHATLTFTLNREAEKYNWATC